MRKRTHLSILLVVVAIVLALVLALPAMAAKPKAPHAIVVKSGEALVVDHTIKTCALIIEEGGAIVAPDADHSVTLTRNGVETGQALETTAGVDTVFLPGCYLGNVVLTLTEANPVDQTGMGPPPPPGEDPPPAPVQTYPFRQALYVDEDGVVEAKSVLAAVVPGRVTDTYAKNIKIKSTGECFDGVFVAGGTYKLTNPKIKLIGNGRSDFVGYGAAVVARGEDTTLVVDGARIKNRGVVRTAVVADTGSNVVVKNSTIQVRDGVLPADYVPTIDTFQMRSVPWMLSLSGNNRATNLLGTNTKASYINSYVAAEGWGVLSTDGCTTPQLTAIDSTIAITGKDGYGSYGIGDATERFLGCTFDVATYATISRGSFLYFGDSTRAAVKDINESIGMGLTNRELARLPVRRTVVNSDRFGIMWHGGGTLDISGGTQFNTAETTLLDKGQAIAVTVDGSKGAALNPGNGVIFQLMDDDDPGPVPPAMTNTGVWHQPTGPVAPNPGNDPYVAAADDALVTLSDIGVMGDFFNGMRGDIPGPFGPPAARNLGLTLENASITGVISASTTANKYFDTITDAEYWALGEVDNTPSAAVNNGVIVSLDGDSAWTVTGTSYLTSLTIADGATIAAPMGQTVSMHVNGAETPIAPGSYSGEIVLTVN